MSLISASSSSSRNYKICLVCEVMDAGIFDCCYEVFVIDVGPGSGDGRRLSGPRELPFPLFRIPDDYPADMGFFAFDSSIYFLGGRRSGLMQKHRLSDDVFVYDTSSGDSTFKQISCMNHRKRSPVIIGPLNEKFYVIGESLGNHDFEQFDPKLDSWVSLSQPPVPYRDPYDVAEKHCIIAHAVVNNDREILLLTPGGLYSYNTDSDEWTSYDNASIPFVYNDRGERGTGCPVSIGAGVSIGADRFLGFTERIDDGHMVLGSYHYNSSDHTWHDFQYIFDWPSKVECAYPMSLGDGVVSAVVSGYDRPVSGYDQPVSGYDFDDDPDPITHFVAIGLFGDGPNFKRLCSRQYKEKYNMKECRRKITASFPLFRRDRPGNKEP